MKRFSVAAAMAGLVMAAGMASAAEPTASKELLVGSWTGKMTIDEAALREDPRFKALPPEQAELAMELVKGTAAKAKVNMAFAEDGAATAEFDGPNFPASEKKKSGTFEVVKTEGAKITVKVTPDNKKDKAQEMTLRFVDEKTMEVESGGIGGRLPKGVAFRFTKK